MMMMIGVRCLRHVLKAQFGRCEPMSQNIETRVQTWNYAIIARVNTQIRTYKPNKHECRALRYSNGAHNPKGEQASRSHGCGKRLKSIACYVIFSSSL